jgi:methylenetetrahydrofolate dehydrogenase (NADP+)/methenyltetrahydrofolate cyclohydrolase
MILLDGKKVSQEIQKDLQSRIVSLQKDNVKPGLGVILVGNSQGSIAYVNMKHKKCSEMGIITTFYHYQETIPQESILKTINIMNGNPCVHGILIQLPLPKHFNTDLILNSVLKEKDVDGFHYYNTGKLFQNKDYLFSPCTPRGCIELLNYYNIDVRGLDITIIGSSNLVGLPLSIMLLHKGATVTICHIDTKNVKDKCLNSDMIIACCGVPHLVKEDWVKKDTIIIDIGTNKIEGSKKLVGDVDFENVKDKCSYITPVPGGIGPMTIITLIQQVIESCENETGKGRI